MRRVLPVFLFLLISSSLAGAADFYQYAAPENGTMSFTDDPKQVPAGAHRLTERSWAATRAKIRWTTGHKEAKLIQLPVYRHPVNPNLLPDCTGPVTLVRERRQVEGGNLPYNRTYFTGVDECGRKVFDSTVWPDLDFDR